MLGSVHSVPPSADLIPKWLPFQCRFVCIQIIPSYLSTHNHGYALRSGVGSRIRTTAKTERLNKSVTFNFDSRGPVSYLTPPL